MKLKSHCVKRREFPGAAAIIGMVFISMSLAGCKTCFMNPEKIDYTPLPGEDWQVSSPEAQGLDPILVDKLYCNAAALETIYSLIVIKDNHLIAEKYFNEGSVEKKDRLQSVTKSYTSALMGIALKEGHLSGVDQKMLDFFSEIAGEITDPRKKEITIRQMLQMRTGYPWEESDPLYWEGLLSGYYIPLIERFPLVSDPGTAFHYSNLTSNWLGIIIFRESGSDLLTFAEKYLFSPLGVEPGEWGRDAEGHNNGCGDLHFSARDAARFGQLYLDDGNFEGEQIIPAEWVHESLAVYSENAWEYRVGRNFNDIGYGYQWWSVRAGDHRYNLAWGHGGQQIALLDDMNMVIVLTADPFWLVHNDQSWKHEKANLNLVADFIASLPKE